MKAYVKGLLGSIKKLIDSALKVELIDGVKSFESMEFKKGLKKDSFYID